MRPRWPFRKASSEAKGLWKGESRLNLSHLPPELALSTSLSELRIDADEAFATIAYTWEHDGQAQRGSMALAMDAESKAVEIGWVDSFHMSASVMHLVGLETDTGAVETKGIFAAGEETWGWTIAFALTGDELTLTMNVIPPGEDAEWAVRATYKRD